MVLGNEVVAKNDPEEESESSGSEEKSVESLIAEVLASGSGDGAPAQNTDDSDTTQTEDVNAEQTEENNNAQIEIESEVVEDVVEEAEEEEEEEEEEELVPEEEEEEEEEELIDQADLLRDKCNQKPEMQRLEERLRECNERVASRTKTAETCHEEMLDWVQAIDNCVAPQLFSKLK